VRVEKTPAQSLRRVAKVAKFIPLILFTVFTNFGSQVLLKKGMTTMRAFEISAGGILKALPGMAFNLYVIIGMTLMVISMVSHLVVLSRVELSYAYPFLGLSFILITLYGHFVLAESVNIYRVSGVAAIVIGVALVARS